MYLIEELLNGTSLDVICQQEDMPTIGIVRQWLSRDPDFRQAYIEAQKVIGLTCVGEMVEIADGDGDVQRDRLRVQTRKIMGERLAPEVFAPPKTDGISVSAGALSEIFKAVSNAGHKLPRDIHEGQFTEVKE